MRNTFHDELARIGSVLVDMTKLVSCAMSKATTALLTADLTLAEEVIAADAEIDRLYRETEDRAYELLARQQPVAIDLRQIVTGLRMVADLERMGDLAQHIAKIARMRYPDCAVPPELHAVIREMGEVAQRVIDKAGAVIDGRDVELATELEQDDDRMDALHRKLFTILLSGWDHGIEPAIDITLLGRFYERFADHAVSVARRVIYLVTGEMPEPSAR
ncbi:phosphate signaling complex protein PhoU [Fodinicola acaciae]|uniref:phosphate signaling complex protein PhoU n=1 Tax=Fodinicola acaciae TaxID=2681555 RepID=UPI0013D205D4|nr:phosphate signaling complex protein PhoU [Fodinicola acaciae]